MALGHCWSYLNALCIPQDFKSSMQAKGFVMHDICSYMNCLVHT